MLQFTDALFFVVIELFRRRFMFQACMVLLPSSMLH